MPMISVVIPVYNVQPYLRECLDSVTGQTLQDLEIILVDDGSTDGSTEICKEYAVKDPRIKLIIQENQGVAAARKAGAALASSPYLGFVDSDDYIDADMYETLINNIGNCDLVTSACYTDTGMWRDCMPCGVYQTEDEMDHIIDNMIMIGNSSKRGITASASNKLFRTAIAKRLFREISANVYFGEDAEFVFRYILACRSVHVADVCKYHYRQRSGSICLSRHDDFLRNLSDLYVSLSNAFRPHPRCERLMEQLQYYILQHVYKAPQKMAFSPSVDFYKYVNPMYNELIGRRIALYGAGVIGQNYYLHMIRRENGGPVVWVDKRYEDYQGRSPVQPVSELDHVEYDYLVIAVKKQDLAESIREELVARGIKKEKILWKEPIYIQL